MLQIFLTRKDSVVPRLVYEESRCAVGELRSSDGSRVIIQPNSSVVLRSRSDGHELDSATARHLAELRGYEHIDTRDKELTAHLWWLDPEAWVSVTGILERAAKADGSPGFGLAFSSHSPLRLTDSVESRFAPVS